MHLRARRYHKNRSAFLCLSFFCVTLLREALVYFYSLQFTPFGILLRLGFRDTSLPVLETRETVLSKNHAI